MSRPKALPALTSLRFGAALWVVLYHGLERVNSPVDRILAMGFVAVPFFFLLSGFILGHVYLSQASVVPAKRFFLSRFARIYPLYALMLLFDLPRYAHVAVKITHKSAALQTASVISSFLMVQGWYTPLTGLNPPSWSLSAEAFFYLLFPFVGPALYRLRKQWVVTLLLCLPFTSLALTALTSPASAPTFDPVRPLPTFLMGILLSRVSTAISADQQKRAWLQRLVLPLVALCLVLLLASTRLVHYHAYLQNGLLAPVFALLILAFTVESRLSTLLSAKWLVLLGEASYGLYLIHMPLKAIIRAPLERHFSTLFPAYLCVTIALSVLSFLYLETPARARILRGFVIRSPESLMTSSIAQ